MRVGLVTYALGVGGVETLLGHLARLLAAGGHAVTVYETLRRGPGRALFRGGEARVRDATARPWETRRRHAARLGAMLAAEDALLLNDAPLAQAALGLVGDRAAAVPVLHLPLPGMVATACANAENWDALVAVSPALALAASEAGCPEGRVVVIPPGCEVPGAWPRAQRPPRAAASPIRIVYAGALSQRQKRVLDLPAIVGAVAAAGVHVRLDIIGDGPERARLRAGLEGVERCESVFHGARPPEDVRAALDEADALLMPSAFEGFGLVVVEAMAAGAVPIASRLPGVTDVTVRDGQSGLLATPGDPADFARQLLLLAREPAAARALSQGAWQAASERFGVEAMAGRYLELFEERAARRRREGSRRSGRLHPALLGAMPSVPIGLLELARRLRRTVRR